MTKFWIIYGALGLLALAAVLWDYQRRRTVALAPGLLLEPMSARRRDAWQRLRAGLDNLLAGVLLWLLWPLMATWAIALARRGVTAMRRAAR